MQWKRAAAVVAVAALLAVAGCDVADPSAAPEPTRTPGTGPWTAVSDPTATGPAEPVRGARKGGMVQVRAAAKPRSLDPTNSGDPVSRQIESLYLRSLTQYAVREGKPVLVPDLAVDLGKVSADKLSWTFRLKPGLKYQDGNAVRAQDIAYAIARSFAPRRFPNGPKHQLEYFLDGGSYRGPYEDGDYRGVVTPDDQTLVIKLAKPFPDLPYFVALPMFTPIPKIRDARMNYELQPMSTGPYQLVFYERDKRLRLTTNPNWDPASDPVRHQYAAGFDFQFGGDPAESQAKVLSGADGGADTVDYTDITPAVLPALEATHTAQQVTGPGPCTTMLGMNTRAIPLPVRKAIAAAYPYDGLRAAAGLTALAAPPASSLLPPGVLGQKALNLAGLKGTGRGNPVRARQLLQAAGRVGFRLVWYFAKDSRTAVKVSQTRQRALTAAGFVVRPIGVTGAGLNAATNNPRGSANLFPTTRCADWPTGTAWFPELFTSAAAAAGRSVGKIRDKALDTEISKVAELSPDEQIAEWSEIDRRILRDHLPALPEYYGYAAFLAGANIGNATNNPTTGMPDFTSLYLRKP